VAYQEGSFYVK